MYPNFKLALLLWPLFRKITVPVAFLSLLLISSCGPDPQNFAFNNVVANLSGNQWIADQVDVQVVGVSNNEIRLTITASTATNETLFIRVTENESNMIGIHEVTSLANGEFLAYSDQVTPSSLESHSSFGCQAVNGFIEIRDFDQEERFVSGFFEGRICRSDGTDLIAVFNGEFTRLEY